MSVEKYRLDQIVPIKQAAQELPKLARRLEQGEGPLVITRRGEPVAMLCKLDDEPKGK